MFMSKSPDIVEEKIWKNTNHMKNNIDFEQLKTALKDVKDQLSSFPGKSNLTWYVK
jgi:uncharacterized protein YpuA (DUF1002 family)